MIAHQTKGVDAVTESLDPLLNQKVEACTILIIEENGSAAIAAQDDVIECSRIVDSWLSCHAATLHHKLHYSKPDPVFRFFGGSTIRTGACNKIAACFSYGAYGPEASACAQLSGGCADLAEEDAKSDDPA